MHKELASDLRLLLWQAARASSRFYRDQVADLDLTPRQATAVLIVVEHPGLTLGKLADELSADQATTSAMIDRLMSAGLVRRETDPADRRRAMLYPTDRARPLAEKLQAARRQTELLLRETLGPDRTAQLRGLLGDLIERLGAESGVVPTGASD